VAPDDKDAGWSVPSWTSEELLAAAAGSGVDRAVLIGHGMIYGYDNGYMLDCARRHPQRFRVVAQIDDRLPVRRGHCYHPDSSALRSVRNRRG
jgi:predicted TIM-barrel fold metal-dependent hydrolase